MERERGGCCISRKAERETRGPLARRNPLEVAIGSIVGDELGLELGLRKWEVVRGLRTEETSRAIKGNGGKGGGYKQNGRE